MLVLVIDLITKHFLFTAQPYTIIPNVLSIASNGGNTGAAWGLFKGKTLALSIVSACIIMALLVFNYYFKQNNMFYCISFGFIVGGAMGNLVDRLYLHYVRDFLVFDFWPSFPVFNFADTFLCIGAFMMVIYLLFIYKKQKSK